MKDTNSINFTANINTISSNRGFILKKKMKLEEEAKNINVKLKVKTIERLDALCKESGHNRSELIKEMVEDCLKNLEIDESLNHLKSNKEED